MTKSPASHSRRVVHCTGMKSLPHYYLFGDGEMEISVCGNSSQCTKNWTLRFENKINSIPRLITKYNGHCQKEDAKGVHAEKKSQKWQNWNSWTYFHANHLRIHKRLQNH